MPSRMAGIEPAFPNPLPLEEVPAKFRELIGLDVIPDQVDFTRGATVVEDGLALTRLTFRNWLGESVHAIAILPAEPAGTMPGVISTNGTASTAEDVAHPLYHRKTPHKGPLYGWGREMVRRGFAVLTFTPKGAASRRGTVEAWEEEQKLLLPFGRSQVAVIADEAVRATRVLGALDGVDPDRIGLTGMSLGGWTSWLGMVAAPWVKTAAPIAGGLGTMRSNIDHGLVWRHSSFAFVPHMLRYFDHPQLIAAAIAPRPFMMVAPLEDEDMPSDGVDVFVDYVSGVYEQAGVPERFLVHRPPGHHVFTMKYFEWAVEWFKRWL